MADKEYDNTNRGVLFRNEEKTKDSWPDYRGRLNAAGTDYWLSGWIKKEKNGNNYLSLAIKVIEPRKAAAPKNVPMVQAELDDAIPF